MLAFARLEIFENFVRHLQAFEMHNADVFGPVFPDLTLLKFERHAVLGETRLSGSILGETAVKPVISFCRPPVCWPPLLFYWRRRYWLWIVSGRTSSGLLLGIYRP